MLSIEQDYRRYSDTPGNIGKYLKLAFFSAGFRAILLYRIGVWVKAKRSSFCPWNYRKADAPSMPLLD